MSIRPLVILPDARLREISAPVGTITGDVRKLAEDMLETMYDAPGVGLAGIQIGEAVRIVTIDTSKEKEDRKPLVLLDPRSSGPRRRPVPTRRAACRSPTITPR